MILCQLNLIVYEQSCCIFFDIFFIKKFDFFSFVRRVVVVIINIFVSIVLKLWFVVFVDNKNIVHFHKCFNQEFRDEILFYDIRFSRWCVFRIVNFDTCVNRCVHIYRCCIRIVEISWNIIRFCLFERCMLQLLSKHIVQLSKSWSSFLNFEISCFIETSLSKIRFKMSMTWFVRKLFNRFIIFLNFFSSSLFHS